MNLVALQFKTTDNFSKNLNKLIKLINKCEDDSLILAPELILNGYSYEKMDEAVEITNIAIPILEKLSENKTISLTMTTKKGDNYFNTLFLFHKGVIKHTQSKYKLFTLNDERKYFTQGDKEDIRIIEIDGIKISFLICFELRFIEFWQKLQGSDIILIPAMWGKLRKENFETLTQALAVMNQCFVLASDSANEDMAKSSGIITPFGKTYRDDKKSIISVDIDFKEIKKMRRYLNINI